jgi:methyltransferase-like protein
MKNKKKNINNNMKFDKLTEAYMNVVNEEAPNIAATKENLTVSALDMIIHGIGAFGPKALANKKYIEAALNSYYNDDIEGLKQAMGNEPWVWVPNFQQLEERGDKAIRVSLHGKRYHWPLTY